MRTLVCMSALLMPLLTWGQTVQLADDFSGYADGADGSPVWYSSSIGWEVRGGRFCVEGPSGIAYMEQQPRFRRISIEATVVLREAVGTQWKVAAVCLYADPRNFWHMALAEAPDGQDGFHFCELVEMKDGVWLSQSNLKPTPGVGRELKWEYDTPYRLRITMSPEGIEGQVFDMAGKQLANLGYAFSDKAVTIGRPALRAGDFRAEFDDVKLAASDPVPEPPAEEMVYPEYEVAALDVFTSKATGFFRTEQRGDRWWIVDPLGRSFYAIGTDHCRYGGHWCQDLGYAPYGRKNDGKWDSRDAWAAQTMDRLKSWGFNLLGAGGGGECRYKGLAHTEFISFGSTFSGYDDICPKVHWTGFPNVFSPKWPAYCDKRARHACVEYRNDPWLFGYFLDNELEWYGKSHTEWGLFDEAMKKPADHTAKRALVDLLKRKYPTVADLNQAWGTELDSFDAILQLEALNGTNAEAVKADKIAFTRLVAEEYFKHTTDAIRKHDPNHMIIGCRFAGNAPAGIWDICGKYCDIVTFNYYGRVDMENGIAPGHVEQFTEYYEQAQKPMMITEWSFPALDSGLPCKHGAGMRVDTQAQKAECFRIYQEMFFRLPFMVGSDYFMWVDEPELGIADTFPEDSNYGLVNEDDEPYAELTAMATRVNATVGKLHNGDYPELGVREGSLVFNKGKAAATFTLRIYLNGEKREQELTLGPGEEKKIDLNWQPQPGGNLVVMEVDPERKTGDGNPTNNRLIETIWQEGVPAPQSDWRHPVQAMVVANHSDRHIRDAVAAVSGEDLPRHPLTSRARYLPQVCDLDGTQLPSQLDWLGVSVKVGDLEPWGCRTFLLTWTTEPARESPPAGITQPRQAGQDGALLSNGALSLERLTPRSGNVFDRISLGDVPLGSYNPLVWQEVNGQNQWVTTSSANVKLTSVGPVRGIVYASAEGGASRPITTVDDEGTQEQQLAEPLSFRVAHHIVVYPSNRWFLARLDTIKNTSQRPLTLKGYFFYLNGAIGGSPDGDIPAGPGVPNYYAWAGAAWQDDEAGHVFGAVPLDDKLTAQFWLDEGGGQHPDARRQLDEPVVLQPGETYRDEDRPWLLIYGGKAPDKPWLQMREVARDLAAIAVTVHTLQ